MFAFLRGIFGKPKRDKVGEAKTPEVSALPSAHITSTHAEEEKQAPDDPTNAFLCRETILGRDQRIIGYEFSHPQQVHARLIDKRARARQYYDGALLSQLAGMQLESIIGQRLAFLDISPVSLKHPALERLPRHNVALTLNFPESSHLSTQAVQEIISHTQPLREYGLNIGLKWQSRWLPDADGIAILQQIDFVRISWPEYADHGDMLVDMCRNVKEVNAAAVPHRLNPLRLIVGDLDAPDDFRECYRLGFDFFCGSFITNKQENKSSKSAVNRLRIIQLLNNLRHDAHTRELEQELKQDPTLSYYLLRYANSPALGLSQEITSLAQAITILGRNYLYRWLSFLLLKVADPGYREWVLTEQALARAALMERLGKIRGDSAVSPDSLFLTGLFSLLDQLMGYSLDELIAAIQIPDEIHSALVRREGILAQYLALAEACEFMIPENIERRSLQLGFSASEINHAVFDALAWAHEMINVNESPNTKSTSVSS
ncbi:MAG: HDOD domain-containing protein [Betaproteobacteria bacterium]|nr:HDOD domain-containing protein [Betaproteobacteria bacterium]